MHILLGILGAAITILILVRRLGDAGFDPSSLNPFQWYRRHKWRQRYHAKPLYNLENPMQAAALLLVATAKCDGDISSNQKQTILKVFEQELQLSEKDAEGYLTSSAYLLRDEFDIVGQVSKILEPSKQQFSNEQTSSLLDMMRDVAQADGAARATHSELIDAVRRVLAPKVEKSGTWQS